MIIFENNGEIDPRSITTFGVSSKDNANAIGYFGTGLKYAIAILLREGCKIDIYSGLNKLSFSVQESSLRNDIFKFIAMNDEPISFTTELGKNWELWQAFRELYCNCNDEYGVAYKSCIEAIPEEGKTKIIVSGKEFEKIYDHKDSIILSENFSIKPRPSKVVYFKGVKVFDLKIPSINTYNLNEGITLTEDRTIKSEWDLQYAMAKKVVISEDKDIITRAVTATSNEVYESKLPYNYFDHCVSDCFKETVLRLYAAKTHNISKNALTAAGLKDYHDLPEESMEINSLNKKKMEKAISFCEKIGYFVTDYPIVITDKLKADHLGLAMNGKIFISPLNFDKGTKYLAGTLIEEYIHNKYGYEDETYQLQTFLFDNIVSLGERLLDEPL